MQLSVVGRVVRGSSQLQVGERRQANAVQMPDAVERIGWGDDHQKVAEEPQEPSREISAARAGNHHWDHRLCATPTTQQDHSATDWHSVLAWWPQKKGKCKYWAKHLYWMLGLSPGLSLRVCETLNTAQCYCSYFIATLKINLTVKVNWHQF